MDAISGHDSHYDAVAGEYEKAWFYENGTPYQAWLVERCIDAFDLKCDDELVDVGALAVEPCAALAEQAASLPGITAFVGDAGDLVASGAARAYDKLLLKEVIHHIPSEALPAFAAGAMTQLRPGGRIVVVTRPHDASHYPMFPGAYDVWKRQQAHYDVYGKVFSAAGFEVSATTHDYPVMMKLETWLAMIRRRFWSTFSHFSDAEIEEGIRYIRDTHLAAPTQARAGTSDDITFPDKLVFLVARKV
jgi:hypothetical protein